VIAAGLLQPAAGRDPNDSRTWHLLASVDEALHENQQAIAAMRRAVAGDSQNPITRYVGEEVLLASPHGVQWQTVQRVYSQWITRYPLRAEWYLASAIGFCEGSIMELLRLPSLNVGCLREHSHKNSWSLTTTALRIFDAC